MEKELAKNVLGFIDWCSKEVGKYEEESHNIDLWNECQDMGMESPIEQIVYCALKTIVRFNSLRMADPEEINGEWVVRGLGIFPQKQIGQYRVDFLVEYTTAKIHKVVIIECDSQQFHEKTEPERRYEKKRDRYFTSKEYKVFHFTGSEICKNTMEVASEIIAFVTDIEQDDLLKNSNIED